MLKRTVTSLFLMLFVTGFLMAQSGVVTEHKKTTIDENAPAPREINTSITLPESFSGTGTSIGLTSNYDYFSNSVIRDQIVYSDGIPHFANMIRPYSTFPETQRHVVYSYGDGSGGFNNVSVFGGQSGWPHIDASLTGSAAGTIATVGHVPSRLAIWDGAGSFLISEFDANTDPSMQFSGDNIYLATSGNRLVFKFYKTEDFGVSFSLFDSIPTWNPSPIWWANNGGVEVGMSKSPDEQYLVYFGSNEGVNGGGAHVYTGSNPNESDNIWAIWSSDAGATWNGRMIAPDGLINAVPGYHTPNYAPLFENFGQIDIAVGNDGVLHVVANGYGLYFDDPQGTNALGSQFPVLYWNSSSETWMAISDEAVDTVQALADLRPGNGIGQSYPGIAVSADGQIVYATWSGPQFTSGVLDTANGRFLTDLYHAFSTDAGQTWTYGGTLSNDSQVSEQFGHPAQHLRMVSTEANSYYADIVYMADLSAGINVFGEGTATLNPIMYAEFMVYQSSSVQDPSLVNGFELAQNYPNPFNPSTKIKFTIAERSNVTLKVFDMLGREVAVLENGVREAGSHEVSFNASNLASGLYVYTINAGSYSASKKMMLLK